MLTDIEQVIRINHIIHGQYYKQASSFPKTIQVACSARSLIYPKGASQTINNPANMISYHDLPCPHEKNVDEKTLSALVDEDGNISDNCIKAMNIFMVMLANSHVLYEPSMKYERTLFIGWTQLGANRISLPTQNLMGIEKYHRIAYWEVIENKYLCFTICKLSGTSMVSANLRTYIYRKDASDNKSLDILNSGWNEYVRDILPHYPPFEECSIHCANEKLIQTGHSSSVKRFDNIIKFAMEIMSGLIIADFDMSTFETDEFTDDVKLHNETETLTEEEWMYGFVTMPLVAYNAFSKEQLVTQRPQLPMILNDTERRYQESIAKKYKIIKKPVDNP